VRLILRLGSLSKLHWPMVWHDSVSWTALTWTGGFDTPTEPPWKNSSCTSFTTATVPCSPAR
jgi:hypothetical protein